MRTPAEAAIFALALVAMIVFFLWAARASKKLDRALTAHLDARGLKLEPTCPASALADLKFEGRIAFRGALAPGVTGTLVSGRGMGGPLTDTVTTSIAGFFGYFYVELPPTPACDDAWLARWQGASRARRLPGGGVVVYWQLADTIPNVEGALGELAAALPVK